MSIAIAHSATRKADRFFAASIRLVIPVLVGSVAIIEQSNVLAQSIRPPQESSNATINSGARVPIVPDQWPWSSIGRINMASVTQRSMCTGTLVGPYTVVTAAHCLFDSRLHQWVKPNLVHFIAGLSPGM